MDVLVEMSLRQNADAFVNFNMSVQLDSRHHQVFDADEKFQKIIATLSDSTSCYPAVLRDIPKLYMTSISALAITSICLLLGALGYAVRKKLPRVAVFLGGIAMCGTGSWTVFSVLELAEKGQTYTFSRKLGTFSESAAPEAFAWSYWFHLGLGTFLLLFGTYLLAAPFTKRGRHINFEQKAVTKSSSPMGVLRLLGLSFVLLVFIWLWRFFVG